MAVKCILTGQTPSVLDGVTENVQTQLNDKVDKVTGKGLSTNDYTSAEKTKLSGIETGAQKNTITGVKGSAETTYRTGNVNITATNIGLGNVDNTSDANKPISNATQAALNDKQSKITANGILKGNGTGGVSAAVKGTDYFTPADVNEIAAEAAKKVDISDKVSKSGDTMTGKLTVPQVETGADNSNFFQCRKFRGEGDANTYYHAIDFGYANHDKVDFHEYGGIWNFFKNTSGKANEGSLCGKITTNGWEGGAKLTGSPTAPTPGTSDNSTRIATTAFVNSFNSTKLESNGDGSNVTAAFTAASSRTNIATGEKLSVLFGKIAKWLSDLGSLAFKSTVAKTDLASDVQTSLGKADSALQSVTKSDVGLGNVDNVKQYSSSNPPPYPVTSVNGQTGDVTVQSGSETNSYTATLLSSGWAADGGYQKQTVTVTGLKASYPVAPVVDAQLSGTDADGDAAILTAFAAVNILQTAENQLIAYCIGDAPTTNIPLIINTWG